MLNRFTTLDSQQPPSVKPKPTSRDITRHERSRQSGGKWTYIAFVILFAAALLAVIAPKIAGAQDCFASAQVETVLSRHIKLDVTCPDAPFFKLSESPDFEETVETGVVVTIDHIDPMGKYADVSIRYPNGKGGGNGIPFAVTETTREVRILAVLFNFSGDGALAAPSYATPAWAEKLVFGGNHDGRGLANSIKAHIEQNTYGTVRVSGEVYPNWVEVSPIETYRDLNLTPTPDRRFAEEIVEHLVDTDPDFFNGKDFDFLIALTPGGLEATTLQPYSLYSNWTDPYGIFEGWAMYDLPIENNSQLYGAIRDEPRVSTTSTIVIPRYNPQSIEGVWLAGDVAHTGINYFTGGRVRYDTSNPNHFAHFIELGTALPERNTPVIVTYSPRAYRRLTDAQMALVAPDTMPDTLWFGLVVHELYHAADWLLNPTGKSINDLYQSPMELIANYDLMAHGNYNEHEMDYVSYYVPGQLSAYSKVNLDIVQPYVLRYGENEIGLRLHKAEEGDFAGTNARVKMIKVPLQSMLDIGYQQLVDGAGKGRKFVGKEYLLLEWRNTGRLENNAFNFDAALPHAGLVIYRVIEGDPGLHGSDYHNVVRIIDATPAAFPFDSLMKFRSQEVYSLETSAAPFGTASGVYDYVASTAWNWKAGTTTSADFQLSPGTGAKMIYAKFMDLNGQVVAETSTSVTLAEGDNAPPVADAGSDQTLTDDDGNGIEWLDLDGGFSFDPDGTILDYEWYESGTLIASGVTANVSLVVGGHTVTLMVSDDQGASGSDDLLITIEAPANVPPIADAGADMSFTDTDGDGVEPVTLYGTGSYDPDGSITLYEWYEDGMLIASGPTASVNLGLGSHSLTLSVTDDRGRAGSDVLIVDIAEGSIPAPSDLYAEVVKEDVRLTWLDNGSNVAGFYVERGTKSKGVVTYANAAIVRPDTTNYAETLAPGIYYFRVRAFGKGGGMSGYSNVVEAKINKGNGKKDWR